MRCSVFNCSSKNDTKENCVVGYYSFPKNAKILKKWLNFCKRKDIFNFKCSRVCGIHFTDADFENKLEFEMGFAKKLRLKADAVPTLYPVFQQREVNILKNENRINRIKKRDSKKLIASLINETPSNSNKITIVNEDVVGTADLINNCDLNQKNIEPKQNHECDALKEEMEHYKLENQLLKNNLKESQDEIQKLKDEVKNLQTNLNKSEFERTNMESRLAEIFTSGQLRKLKNGSRRLQWTEADIARSITLYSAGPRSYKLLRNKNFPLPAIRTLQKWAQKIEVSPGVLNPVMKIMKSATQLTEDQKVCVLSFDEIKIRETYCYDKLSDTTLKPAKYCQVVMLRGLMAKWKQPFFYDFDCKMTKIILFEILEKVKDCGYTVVAITSDLGGGNRGLYKELNIEVYKPWFLFDNNKIFVFADVPHLIKLIRNHFIDDGFIINGKCVKKEIILKLLSCTSTELSVTHKISNNHLNVARAERQKVKMATKLFSHTVAQALSRAATSGLITENNWEECYNLFKLTNDWFDVMNVRLYAKDSRQRMKAYGLATDVQDDILDRMSKLMMEMNVAGKTTLLPFQKGIIQSNNAIKLLYANVKQRFNFKYILTYRLNQDVLENFFGTIRAKGGLHDHPDRQEFKFRLRSYILGHNEGVISENANVTVDDTPDLEIQESTLTGSVFRNFAVPNDNEDCMDENDFQSMEYDGLENLAGYICHKLHDQVENIRVDPTVAANEPQCSWVDLLNEGGLSKPTEGMMIHMARLEKIFNDANGDDLLIRKDFQKYLVDLSKDVECDIKIKKMFFRARMYFRIRKLNKEIIEVKSKKRKYKKIIT